MSMPIVMPVCQFPVFSLTPIIRAAVEETIAVTQAPAALIASSALAAAALAVQAKYDVERMPNLISPCSLYFITFGESGERKTTVDRLLFTPFVEFEDKVNFQRAEAKGCDAGVSS